MDTHEIDFANAGNPQGEDVLAPSKTYVANAIPRDDGYLAQFSAPGLIPRYVSHAHNNDPIVYDTEEDAKNAARDAMMRILNAPRRTQVRGKNARYEKMTGPEFAVALAESGLSLTLFAFIFGTSVDRAQQWIDGVDNVPHPARVLLALFRDNPQNVDIAEQVTESVTTDRRPRSEVDKRSR